MLGTSFHMNCRAGRDPNNSSSGLENTLREYAGSPTPGASGGTPAFSGKGHTLGESSSSNSTGPSLPAITGLTNVDPQVKLLLGFVGAYLVLWYLSS